jgi:hypothetical protein
MAEGDRAQTPVQCHGAFALVAAIAFYLLSEAMPPGDGIELSVLPGMLFGAFGAINGRHSRTSRRSAT